jgi:tetrathionate reductase subunit C
MFAAVPPLGATPQNLWGLNHATWFLCMGLGSAFFLNRLLFGIDIGQVFGLPLADVLGIILVGFGGIVLLASLGRPFRILGALRNPMSSWISRGAIADFVFIAMGVLLLLPQLALGGVRPLGWLPWAPGTGPERALAWAAAAPAVFIIVYPGLVLAVLRPIPFWNTAFIPLQYLSSAFASAAGMAYMLGSPPSARAPAVVAVVSVLGTLALSAAHILSAYARKGTARLSANLVMRGSWAPHFVLGSLFLGLVVPGLILAIHLAGGLGDGMLALAGVLLLAGNFLSKYAVIKAGYLAPVLVPTRTPSSQVA